MSRIVYIHVPKCGGSSFGAALRLRFLFSQASIPLNLGDQTLQGAARIQSDYADRLDVFRQCLSRNLRLITGHVQYDPALHRGPADAYKFVTLLRDPVERFVSHYNYLMRKHPDAERPQTLDAFLKTKNAERLGSQYLWYFAGPDQADHSKQDLVERAIENLMRFSLVGDLAQPKEFAQRLSYLVGSPLPLRRRNVAPSPTIVPPKLLRQIQDVCAPDIAIYEAFHAQRAIA